MRIRQHLYEVAPKSMDIIMDLREKGQLCPDKDLYPGPNEEVHLLFAAEYEYLFLPELIRIAPEGILTRNVVHDNIPFVRRTRIQLSNEVRESIELAYQKCSEEVPVTIRRLLTRRVTSHWFSPQDAREWLDEKGLPIAEQWVPIPSTDIVDWDQ